MKPTFPMNSKSPNTCVMVMYSLLAMSEPNTGDAWKSEVRPAEAGGKLRVGVCDL